MQETGFILVPLDGSKNAENALPAAARIARAFGLDIRFIHVVSAAEGPWGRQDVTAAHELFVPYARALGERYGVRVPDEAIDVAWGQAAQEILRKGADARLIVIASHGRGGFRATFIGSVADKVVRGAKRPVLVIPGVGGPEELDPSQPILVAMDGSDASQRALCVARKVGKQLGAPITILQSYTLPPAVGAEFVYYPADYAPALRRAAEDFLADIAQRGERALVVNGNPATGIVEVARDIDASMVVMASSGKGLAKRITLGSTTDRVLHALRRPLLIVPSVAEVTEEDELELEEVPSLKG